MDGATPVTTLASGRVADILLFTIGFQHEIDEGTKILKKGNDESMTQEVMSTIVDMVSCHFPSLYEHYLTYALGSGSDE